MVDKRKINRAAETIRKAASARGTKLPELANELGVTYQLLYRAITCRSATTEHSIFLRTSVAKKFDLEANKLWPKEVMNEGTKKKNHLKFVVDDESLTPALSRSAAVSEALAAKGLTLTDISKSTGVAYSSVWTAADGKGNNDKLRQVIARKCGMKPKDLWPARFRPKKSGIKIIKSARELVAVSGLGPMSVVQRVASRLPKS